MAPRALSFALTALAASLALAPLVAEAGDKLLEVLPADELARAPSHRYASLGRDAALGALRERGAIFDEVPAGKAPGVLAPIRLTARLGGVHVHGMLKGEASVSTPFEIADARLALALDDFAKILKRHGVTEITHFSMYRPGGSASHPPEANATTRHPAGLAIDVATFRRDDGTTLSVAKDFGGRIGAKTCGDGAASPDSPAARELRAIVCEAAAAHVFTYILTPNYNAAHRDHFHMEVKPGVSWMLIH